jgi:FG-GAP repeat
MLFSKRKSQRPMRSRRVGSVTLRAERLERRDLLAIDLTAIAGTAGNNGFGVEHTAGQAAGGAGWSVAEVGDTNGDGFDDYLIGAPTVTFNGAGFGLGSGSQAKVYLIYGSRQVNNTTIQDFLNLTVQQRVSDLAQLGNTNQTNPVNGLPGFDFNGLTFFTSQNLNSQVGASVAAIGDVNGDGLTDFVIGAPGANDVLGSQNAAGRAYLVYGNANFPSLGNKLVDLDNPATIVGLNEITFVSDIPGGHLGRSVGTAGAFLGNGGQDVAIGAPDAQINNLGGSGVVYVVSDANGGVLRPMSTQTVLITTIGQPNGTAGVQISGANASDQAGFSVASAGDTSGSTFSDLLIGAPANNIGGAGTAYLLYGSANYPAKAVLDPATGITYINLNRILTPAPGTPDVPGAVFVGDASLDQTGWAVAGTGDFNGDGLSDYMIGAPGEHNSTGRVSFIFGRSATGGAGPITGLINLGAIPTSIDSVTMEGAQINALAGYSLSGLGDINGDGLNEIIIGSPGFNNFSGAVYVIPGNPSLFGDTNLGSVASAPLQGQIITSSLPLGPNLVGSSVSGALRLNGSNRSVDGAAKTDFIIGAAGLSFNTARNLAGAGFLIETSRITLPVPTSSAITTQIGVDTAFPPFNINQSTPATMQIFVFSNANVTPVFDPVRDIDPATVVVNGVAFPNATIAKDPIDENNDGIEDAIITIQPRSAIGLTTSTTSLTIRGKTLASSPNANRVWTGTAAITVTGGGGGGGAIPGNINNGFAGFGSSAFPPAFGERLVPTLPVVGKNAIYKPIPQFVAYQTFRPNAVFSERTRQFFSPRRVVLGTPQPGGHRTTSLGHQVFTRSKFPRGVFNGKIHHKGKVI